MGSINFHYPCIKGGGSGMEWGGGGGNIGEEEAGLTILSNSW